MQPGVATVLDSHLISSTVLDNVMILHLAAALFLISSSHFNPSLFCRPFYVYGRFHADAFLASSLTQRLGMSSGEKANEAVRTSENHQARGF